MKLYLYMIDDNNFIFFVLFGCSLLFIVVPLLANAFQLHSQLSIWVMDPILKNTDFSTWILSYARLLYLITFISGSAFSAVGLVNTYLFQLPIFAMGLSRFHQRNFAQKRLFFVVMLEVSYIMLQI